MCLSFRGHASDQGNSADNVEPEKGAPRGINSRNGLPQPGKSYPYSPVSFRGNAQERNRSLIGGPSPRILFEKKAKGQPPKLGHSFHVTGLSSDPLLKNDGSWVQWTPNHQTLKTYKPKRTAGNGQGLTNSAAGNRPNFGSNIGIQHRRTSFTAEPPIGYHH